MKIGFLNAFTPEEETRYGEEGERERYRRFFRTVPDPPELEEYNVTRGRLPASPAAYDAYLVTGSPSGVYDGKAWIDRLGAFIRDAYAADKKLVGICFGHQILAHALGGRAEKSEKGWGLGLRTFEIEAQRPWMTPALAQCRLHFIHQDQVVRLPPHAERLGGDDFCPNALFAIGAQVLGLQGHPEYPRPYVRRVLEERRERVGVERAETALRSLESGPADSPTVAQWIANFLQA